MSSVGLSPSAMSPYTAMMAAYNPAIIRSSGISFLPTTEVTEHSPGKFQEGESPRQLPEEERNLISSQRPNTFNSADLHLGIARSSGQQQQKPSQAPGNDDAPPHQVPGWEGQLYTVETKSGHGKYDGTRAWQQDINKSSHDASSRYTDIHTEQESHLFEVTDHRGSMEGLKCAPTKIFFIHFQHRIQFLLFLTSISLV